MEIKLNKKEIKTPIMIKLLSGTLSTCGVTITANQIVIVDKEEFAKWSQKGLFKVVEELKTSTKKVTK